MTVANNNPRNQYTATSGQTIFAYTFEIFAKEDIVVLQNGAALSEGTDFTVSGVGNDNGGNVTLTTGATANDLIVIYRDMDLNRTVDYQQSGDFLAQDVNDDFDRLWLALQQVDAQTNASVHLSITTQQLINTTLLTDNNSILTTGFTSEGDGGAGIWRKTGVTGLTASQSPADLGDAKLTDASGNEWAIVPIAGLSAKAIKAESIGFVGDGATDNTSQFAAAVAWCDAEEGQILFSNGVYVTNEIHLNSGEYLNIAGVSYEKTRIKLANSRNTHLFQVLTGGRFIARDMTIDQNETNQTAGHGVRLGGCDRFYLENVMIQNCYSYGIGVQAGTNKNMYAKNIKIHTCGQDAIDIKDYNNDNETFTIEGFEAYNYGLYTTQQVALDFRGPVLASSLDITIQGNNRGVRCRPSGPQGRGGSGVVKGIKTTSDGLGTSVALDVTSDSNDFVFDDISIDDVSIAILQPSGGIGGIVSNVVASNLYGTDCISIGGSDLMINGIIASNTVASSRILDVESTASDMQLSNFSLTDNSGNPAALRITAGSTGCRFSNGAVAGGTISDSGTNTVFENVKGATAKGMATSVADGGTIAHGLGVAPKFINLSGTVASNTVVPTSVDATNITVAIKDDTGAAGTTQDIYWEASL